MKRFYYYKRHALILVVFIIAITAIVIVNKNIHTDPIPSQKDEEVPVVDPLIAKLSVPAGFTLSIFAKDVKGARVIAFDPKGRMLVSQTGEGKIALLADTDSDGQADSQTTLISGLKNPHGLAFACKTGSAICDLYVVESNALDRFQYDSDTGTHSDKVKLISLNYSSTDRHFTRTLLFLPPPEDNILLISVGSSCNVCHEDDAQRGAILSYNTTTKKLESYARGLRNAVFMAQAPDGNIWATEMGRDNLGDNIPPDEINIIQKDKNYGWPVCYGKNIHDDVFDKNTYIRNPCMEPFETTSHIDLPAHSAPLGLAFVPKEWPAEMRADLLVAFHGSWNRSIPTGYKIVRMQVDENGNYVESHDFLSGWLGEEKLGRPVDIKIHSGEAYISDDFAGIIYRLTYIQ